MAVLRPAVPMPRFVPLVLVGLLVFLAQWLVLGRLGIGGAIPDAGLLFVALLGLRYGRRTGVVAGLAMGLLYDATYETWGMHMFIDSLVGFLVGLFPASERETVAIQPQQALLGGFVIALVHNGLVVFFSVLDTHARSIGMITGDWIGGAVYTAGLAFVAALIASR